jgi:hypothetical protein
LISQKPLTGNCAPVRRKLPGITINCEIIRAMWLALRLCRTAGIAGVIECRKKVVGAAPFCWSVVDLLLKESVVF